MKKWIVVVCTIVLAVAMLPISILPATAAEISGVCGDELTWTYDNKILTIFGTGAMYDYSEDDPAPWREYVSTISRVEIKDGVTTVGDYAFADVTASRIFIPASVHSVGSQALRGTRGYVIFYGYAPDIAEDAFLNSSASGRLVFAWDDEEKQDYGGSISWYKLAVAFVNSDDMKLVELNKVFQPEDMNFKFADEKYIPQQVTFGPYDNSTYGEKTVEFTADGNSFKWTYFVTDGVNHLDLIKMDLSGTQPKLTMGSQLLVLNKHYYLKHNKSGKPGIESTFTIEGIGICEGFEKTFYDPVYRTDIAQATVSTEYQVDFNGMPQLPEVTVKYYGSTLTEGEDYQLFYENNVNIGTATIRVVGMGDYYGEVRKSVKIVARDKFPTLTGNYLGKVDEELNQDNLKTTQYILSPCKISTRISTSEMHIAFYALYRMEGEEMILIDEFQSKAGYKNDTAYRYDFSSVYEGATDKGGEVYILSYSWVTASEKVYGGAMFFIIPAKVPDATSMTMDYVQYDGDFRKEFLSVSSDDGALGEVQWTSSDTSVATVEKGTVTMHKPGTVTITAQCGELLQSHTVSATALDLTQGLIYDYWEKDNSIRLIYDNRLLEEGTDYVLSVEKNGDTVTVTATGCGLFTGELVKVFENLDSLADPHTHGFTNSCDGTCNSCDFTRDNDHTFSEEWSKNLTHHWHTCVACGEKADSAEHIVSSDDQQCTVCGTLWIPGDMNGDFAVNNLDVEYLLWYTLYPEDYPLLSDSDFTGDGAVNNLDVEYLLWYTLYPEDYPL